MKKLTFLAAMIAAVSLSVAAVTANAESTDNWMPHNYVVSGYDIPTAMTYGADGSVTFSGSLNAGIATTGFNYLNPIDVTNFTIDMTLNIPDIEHLAWISIGFLDTNLMTDAENSIAPVSMPFNAMSGYGGYQNNVQHGGVLQFDTTQLNNNILSVYFNEKNLDCVTGELTQKGWNNVTQDKFAGFIKLDETYNGTFKLSLSANGDGVAFNLNDGAWKSLNLEGDAYTDVLDCLNAGNALEGFKSYFTEHECYFSFVMMYSDGDHRNVSLKVNSVNGEAAGDNKAPSYAADKVIEKDGLKVTVPAKAVGVFGVYPFAIDGIKVNQYDEEDGDYETVAARAANLGMETLAYFKVIPTVDGKNLTLKDFITVEYDLPEGYSEYKVYYINEDDEAAALGATYAKIENGKAVIRVDNEFVSKVVVYGAKPSSEKPAESQKKGCKGGMGSAAFAGIAVLAAAFVFKRKA